MAQFIFFIITIINCHSILAPKNNKNINVDYPSKEEILSCREYLRKAGYPGRANQLSLLEFFINLQEIDYEDLTNLRYLLVANYWIDELDRTALSHIDLLENTIKAIDKVNITSDNQGGFTTYNTVTYDILEKITAYMHPLKNFEKDYRYRKDKDCFIKELASKFAKVILKTAMIKESWVIELCEETGNNLNFIGLIKEEIDTQSQKLLEEYEKEWDWDQKNLVCHIKDELSFYFKDKIKQIKKREFFKKNTRVTEV